MQAYFLGPAEKLTHPSHPEQGRLQDFQIRLEDVPSFPRIVHVKILDRRGWWFEWPHNGMAWAAVVVPTSDPTKVLINFPAPEEARTLFGTFYEENSIQWQVTVTFATGEPIILQTVDGRKQLSIAEELDYLKNLSDWPEAVPGSMICDDTSEQDKSDRAQAIIEEFIGNSTAIAKLNVLDFGCGEGHVAKQAADFGAALSVGYDIQLPALKSDGAYVGTTSWADVVKKAPYDVVFAYDVLDHVEDVEDVLNKIRSVVKFNTVIVMRCHPWCSRHGGHLYKNFNKAFAHLILLSDELASMNLQVAGGQKIVSPLREYRSMFEKANLQVVKQEIIQESMDSMLFDSILRKRWNKINIAKSDAEISFIDFKLSPIF